VILVLLLRRKKTKYMEWSLTGTDWQVVRSPVGYNIRPDACGGECPRSIRYRPIQAVIIDPKIDIGPIISRGLTLCKSNPAFGKSPAL
jgi:hypothetical protein